MITDTPRTDAETAWKSFVGSAPGTLMQKGYFFGGWYAAMKAAWEQFPMEEFLDDITEKEVQRIADFIKSNQPNATPEPTPKQPNPALDAALALVDFGPAITRDRLEAAFTMCAYCQDGEDADQAAARIIAEAFREQNKEGKTP